tara:strand:+ start:2317 stop:2724 length:408 start_codon:yes stop_codon:yes gene_type:complete
MLCVLHQQKNCTLIGQVMMIVIVAIHATITKMHTVGASFYHKFIRGKNKMIYSIKTNPVDASDIPVLLQYRKFTTPMQCVKWCKDNGYTHYTIIDHMQLQQQQKQQEAKTKQQHLSLLNAVLSSTDSNNTKTVKV